jgi:hypothetical protein
VRIGSKRKDLGNLKFGQKERASEGLTNEGTFAIRNRLSARTIGKMPGGHLRNLQGHSHQKLEMWECKFLRKRLFKKESFEATFSL